MSTGMRILDLIAYPFVAFIVGMLYMGIARNIIGRIHRRWGPPVFQNLIDVFKLYRKREAGSHGVMFHLGPIIMMTGVVTCLYFVPILSGGKWLHGFSFEGDLILVTYLMVLGALGMALGVGQGGVPFGVMGVTRGLTRLIGLEIPYFIAIIVLMAHYNTASINKIMELQAGGISNWAMFKLPLAFIASLFSFWGMMGASPFDIPGAPQEVASGPATEFGGKYLALMMSTRGIFGFLKLTLWVYLFMGGAANLLILIAKTFVMFISVLFVTSVYSRFKVEQAVDFMWKYPTLIGLIALVIEMVR